MGHQERLLLTVEASRFGHVTRHEEFSKTILQVTFESGRHHKSQVEMTYEREGVDCSSRARPFHYSQGHA